MWVHERWWFKLAHVCRRWRYLVLGSASHLGLCLLCTYGTPVADMLAHSPPFPIIIDYIDEDREVTTEDEEGILLALRHRDRVRRIRLWRDVPNLRTLLMALDDGFPILEFLYIEALAKQDSDAGLMLPKTLQAPHLRHLVLDNFAIPIGSPLLTASAVLATLSLINIHPSAYFTPNDLLQRLSLLPQLETLGIEFYSPIPYRDVEMQLSRTPMATHVTLPTLRWFGFRGTSAYLEALLPRMTTPLLQKLQVLFFNQLTFSIPHLVQFIRMAENLRFGSVRIEFFAKGVNVFVHPSEEAGVYALYMHVICKVFDWQVASAAHILTALGTMFSDVEHLTLEYGGHFVSAEWHNEADRTQWRELLRSFSKVKTLRVDDELIWELSHSLRLEEGESPLELLPELKKLSYPASGFAADLFAPFLYMRQSVGAPVVLVRRASSRSESLVSVASVSTNGY
ncbi:hypothetical protein F5148DRAFT_1214955 [Russula earlei]|uniref:Uncharacterized protein n=1 Tax=Russula earlei TaxID=71964 RepID=A0ACC0U516_9AGAM|nr:hypothetical protein F5148DRAFT_1214955 [Russula earlei]